ncbi:hypothetical protein KP79_PYT11757 [Mizuhopecten yessoensis]|uniref:Uncharacterized protein n=1 Tax=Mizuhopecten yessoensis TaxID=6573 RepID=A0A210PS71_MIZYE|nr:hypothetical protein KP79_PYT11757 [Mizuhopecten yessoensis]
MKRFFHYSPFILKNKNTKSNKAKLKSIQRKQEKGVYRPFNSFGFFINPFTPLNTESVEKDQDFSESVPELTTEEQFNLQKEEIPSFENDVLDWPNEQPRIVPNLFEIESVETIRPKLRTSNTGMSDVANEEKADFSDNDQYHENHFGIAASKATLDAEDNVFGFGDRHHSPSRINIIPPGDDSGNSFSDQMQRGVSIPTKETAKNLDLPQIVLEPIHQRASVPGDFGQALPDRLGFADSDGNLDQSTFEGFSDEPFGQFSTDFNDGFENSQAGVSDHGTFRDIIQDNSDFSNGGHFQSGIPDETEFPNYGEFLDQSKITDKDLLSPTGSIEGSFAPYENIDNFYDEQFGGGFENLGHLDSSDIAGGEFFNDGNDFEGFFDTDQSGCEGIRTRSCNVDAECSCLGLYFCVEGTCGMRAALPIEGHGK